MISKTVIDIVAEHVAEFARNAIGDETCTCIAFEEAMCSLTRADVWKYASRAGYENLRTELSDEDAKAVEDAWAGHVERYVSRHTYNRDFKMN